MESPGELEPVPGNLDLETETVEIDCETDNDWESAVNAGRGAAAAVVDWSTSAGEVEWGTEVGNEDWEREAAGRLGEVMSGVRDISIS